MTDGRSKRGSCQNQIVGKRTFGPLIGVLLTCILCARAATDRVAPPSEDSQQNSKAVVEEAYRKELSSAHDEDSKAALARKMVQAASETLNDQSGQFVLLKTATRLAIESGDVETALAAIIETARIFDVDELSLKSQAVLDVGLTN